jgi:hypothetical protein
LTLLPLDAEGLTAPDRTFTLRRTTMAKKAFTGRHLSACETKVLLALIEECGPSEVLRIIGQYLANEIPSVDVGSDFRSKLNKLALGISRVVG